MTNTGKIHKICLIGCGVSGTVFLLKLLETIAPEDICMVDPAFDGGDLARHWSAINSNTTWQLFLDSIDKLPIAKSYIDKRRDKFALDSITPVWELSNTLRQAMSIHMRGIDSSTCYAKSANYDTEAGVWTIRLESPGCSGIKKAKTILFAPGGIPKQVNLSKHQIPLEIALDSSRLARVIEPGQHILLFGLAHSGVLVLRNLLALDTRVSVIYRTAKPFAFARDGAYQGIKQEAATFADELLANPNPNVTFIQSSDAELTIRAYTQCTAVISAIGFSKNTGSCTFSVDGNLISQKEYDPSTAVLVNAPHAFGFGIAYPSVTNYEGKIYEDAGVYSFVNHALATYQNILDSALRSL